MIPLHLMAEKATKFSSVVLQGDGGDEIFAGYGRHLDLMKLNQRKTMFSLLQNLHYSKKQREFYKSRFEKLNEKDFASLMAGLVGTSCTNPIQNYFSQDLGKHLFNTNPNYQYELRNKAFEKLHPAQKMLYTDMEIILPHTFMEKSDKINMYHSIESRVPLLDNELSEYVMKLPVNYKIRKGITKSFFREVVSDLIPEHILYGRKRSFGTPMIAWMKTTLHDFAIAEFNAGKKAGLPINYDFVFQQMLDLKAGKIAPENVGILWRLLVLNIWLGFYKDKLSFI
jgi:asparagine synthase (glutamine-hydrolysing)